MRMKLLIVLALCGAALSEVFFEEKFDTLDAWVQSTHKGAEAGEHSTCVHVPLLFDQKSTIISFLLSIRQV